MDLISFYEGKSCPFVLAGMLMSKTAANSD